MLTIGKVELDCDTFRVRGSYSSAIARLFSLPVAIASREPLSIEITIRGDRFKPYEGSRSVFWGKKYVGHFVLSSVSQEWEGDRYRVRLELKQCERSPISDASIPIYRWRYDLVALSKGLIETDGALVEVGRQINPFVSNWKASATTATTATITTSPAVVPIAQGGTGATTPISALINLGGISVLSRGLPSGVAPLGSDGKVPADFLPPSSGGGGGSISFPVLISQGGTGALDAATARSNLGAIAASSRGSALGVAPLDASSLVPPVNLPAYPTLASLGAIAASSRGSALGVAPLDANSLVPPVNLPAYPTLASLGAIAASSRGSALGVAPLDANSLVPPVNLPAYPTLASLGAIAASSRGSALGIAPLDANSLVPLANLPLASFFSFTAGVSFRGVTSPAVPAIDTTVLQTSVDASGLPRYWLVNASATANNRIKSMTVANNGNIQFRHHTDSGVDGNVLEHTASGNILTNGTIRCGSGTTHFTGASFVPGALYFRSDLAMLLYSDGTNWRRMDTNAIVT